ncbi:hypothetical protein [Streptomyces bauhiniae]|uniref:hypothetical protein n=1 Tax=Streptomyces bauhiniae TaxID=2340725 RepID=UPI001943EF82|nr:hypothetical protein [Streptomyces bauhiniae]
MTSGLTVTINDQPVPLDECGWFERRPCGCIVSAIVAVVGDRVIATPDQALRHWYRTKRERDARVRDGITVELMTMAYYREHVGSRWECHAHAAPVASSASLVAPVAPEPAPNASQDHRAAGGAAGGHTDDPAVAVATWNTRYPVGTPVTAYPGVRPEDDPTDERLDTRTRSEAQVLGGHTAVVWVDGHSACIALTHVDPAVVEGTR